MARLIYFAITSLDGYVADEHGSFDWSAPDEEVHAFVNEQERSIGTQLYGRRLYEVMRVWEDWPVADEPAVIQEYAEIWRATDKVVYSSTLPDVSTTRTRLERSFDAEAVRELKQRSASDLTVGGAELAGHALRAGLVDEVHQLLSPVVVGGGTRFLPDGVQLTLELIAERRFGNGVVHLAYRVLS